MQKRQTFWPLVLATVAELAAVAAAVVLFTKHKNTIQYATTLNRELHKIYKNGVCKITAKCKLL